jgi:hypothetical protein
MQIKFTNVGKKESQKELIKEIMDLDAKDGLYEHIGDVNKMIEVSDEEIESAAVLKYGGDNFAQQRANIDKILAFEEGAKWYREQLKNIDKKL